VTWPQEGDQVGLPIALVAREGSGIDKSNLATLKGKKIAASYGEDVTLVNTRPPDMTLALMAKGIFKL
jgi:sulfonate transport system substrate-binding protein